MIVDELARIAKGEVLSDSWSKLAYSVDASHYEISPWAIVCPEDKTDVQRICRHCFLKNMPVTARGAGTGLLGQSLSQGVILDFTKHMNRILEIGEDYVTVQPGAVKGILDRELEKRNKFLPPDPASSNYCTIGGMIANNSSGPHCLGYGNTIDYIQKLDLVYSDGSAGFAGPDGYDSRLENFLKLLSTHVQTIKQNYPTVSKNSCGYRLDAAIGESKFSPQKLFAASEGTLAVITSATLKIIDMPLHRCLMVLGFEDLLSAVSAVPNMLKFNPVALEMLDHTVFIHGENTRNLAGDAGCILFVEFAGDKSGEIEDQMKNCRDGIAGTCSVIEYSADEQSIAKIWQARKSALNQIMKMTLGSRKPVGLIEDTVVKPNFLAEHTRNLLQTYADNKLDYVMYGHVGDGNLHTRPLIDISSKTEIDMMGRIADKIFSTVIQSGGTITGEHGDGIARTSYIESMYGHEIMLLFKQVKKLFDPTYIMNPGKKVKE